MGESGHWYNRQGESRHEVDGKPTTLRDARKNGWVPSSTTVLQVYPKPGLENAIRWELVLMTKEFPRRMFPDLSDWDYYQLIVSKQKDKSMEAARVGTIYHHAIEALLKDEELPESSKEIPVTFFPAFKEWWNKQGLHGVELEQSFASSLGYGGRIDCIAVTEDDVHYYIDWKTQDTKEGKKVQYWETWPLQLESYARGDQNFLGTDIPNYVIMSVVVSRNEPGRIESKTWLENDRHWNAFVNCLEMWKYMKNYDPGWGE
jgi:hypothetical protein